SGSIRSPNFPRDYPHNAECTWTITVPRGRYVKLMFGTFDVETFYHKDGSATCIDLVEVKDGGDKHKQLLGAYCNSNRPPYAIISSSNQIRVWFNSDRTVSKKGFNATFTSHEDKACGGVLKGPRGVMKSPRYMVSPYPNDANCEWVIEVEVGKFIRLSFVDFGLEVQCARCLSMSMSSPIPVASSRFCNFKAPEVIVSSGNEMTVRFQSSLSVSNGKFTALFLTHSRGCGDIIYVSEDGTLESPRYPSEYGTDHMCTWVLSAKPEAKITIEFEEFSLQPPNNGSKCIDFLEIRDGQLASSALLDTYCGTNTPAKFTSTANYIRLTFMSDRDVTAKGFKLLY
ncbi:predicted protein, partial [Nematostella vectensis]